MELPWGPSGAGGEEIGCQQTAWALFPAEQPLLHQFYVLGLWTGECQLSNGFGAQKQVWKPLVFAVAASPVIPSLSEP